MKLFGLSITRTKALSSVSTAGSGWWPVIRESFAGAWQRNVKVDEKTALAFHAVFSCMTLIASDIAKLRVKLVELDADGIWKETTSPAYSPVLRKPNSFQTRIQFWETYFLSKLSRGNTYTLKGRDNRGVVTALYVLDPCRSRPLVSDSGEVFYQLDSDNLAGLPSQVIVPAREIIHDRWNCLFHPLVGLSPLYACGLAAMQGTRIQENATRFFENGARPSGVLTAPAKISDETAARLKAYWEANFSGENAGKVAVLGDGLKYEAMSFSPEDAQTIEQLKYTAEVICSTFHIPLYKLGLGPMPTANNVQALNLEYYTQALQVLIESAELCLDEGMGIGEAALVGTEFDIDGLLRMDTATQMEVLDKGKNIMTPDEARGKINLPPTPGGNVVYRQQQDYSLAALAKRDAKEDPFEKGGAPSPAPANDGPPDGKGAQIIDLWKVRRRAMESLDVRFRRAG
jgi:HK97 family phage portal protein